MVVKFYRAFMTTSSHLLIFSHSLPVSGRGCVSLACRCAIELEVFPFGFVQVLEFIVDRRFLKIGTKVLDLELTEKLAIFVLA